MVLPWLIVGACSAVEMRRRNEPAASERECRRLQEVEKRLQRQKKVLDKKFKAKQREIRDSQTTQDNQQAAIKELEEMKVQYEERLTDLNKYAEELKSECDHLRTDNAEWRSRADEYLQQNIALQGSTEMLKIENGELKDKLKTLADTNTEQVADLEAMVEQVKESVQQSLNSFTCGECTAADLQERLMAAGVQVTCKPEQLEDIRANPEATKQLTDTVGKEFSAQLSFVMDDHDRLRNFMGIAQSLKNAPEHGATSSSASNPALAAAASAWSAAPAGSGSLDTAAHGTGTPAVGLTSMFFDALRIGGASKGASESGDCDSCKGSIASAQDTPSTSGTAAAAGPFPEADSVAAIAMGVPANKEKKGPPSEKSKPVWNSRTNIKTKIGPGNYTAKHGKTRASMDLKDALGGSDDDGSMMSSKALTRV